jgi:hypothetical protein
MLVLVRGHSVPTVTPPDRHVTPSPVWLEPAWRAGIARYRAPATDTVMSQECLRRTWPQSDRLRSAASGLSTSSAWYRKSALLGSGSRAGINRVRQTAHVAFCGKCDALGHARSAPPHRGQEDRAPLKTIRAGCSRLDLKWGRARSERVSRGAFRGPVRRGRHARRPYER